MLRLLPAWVSLALAGHLRGREGHSELAACPLWARAPVGREWQRLDHQIQAVVLDLDGHLSRCSEFCATAILKSAPNLSGSFEAVCAFEKFPLTNRCSMLVGSVSKAEPAVNLDVGGESYACLVARAAEGDLIQPYMFPTSQPKATLKQGNSTSREAHDDPCRQLVTVTITISMLALLFGSVALCLLCRVICVYRRLGRGLSPTTSDGTVVRALKRLSKQEELFLSFVNGDDTGESAGPPHASARYENFGGVSFHGQEGPNDTIGTGSLQGGATDFNGCWECVETHGLDQFLQAIKVGRLRRLAATKAPWPSWQFTQKGSDFTYINRSKFGVMLEAFKADGSEYQHKDLEGNETTCRAYLKGNVLTTERTSPQGGMLTETRAIQDDDTLVFSLEMEGVPVKWGRRFIRKINV